MSCNPVETLGLDYIKNMPGDEFAQTFFVQGENGLEINPCYTIGEEDLRGVYMGAIRPDVSAFDLFLECAQTDCERGRHGCGTIGRACLETRNSLAEGLAAVKHVVENYADIPRTPRATR